MNRSSNPPGWVTASSRARLAQKVAALPRVKPLVERSRWTNAISVDAWSPSQELGVFHTSCDAIAEHLVTVWQRTTGAPRGRASDPQTDGERLREVAAWRASAEPVARRILDDLDTTLNEWFRSLLLLEPIGGGLSDDQLWNVLERYPPDRALSLLSVPHMQRAIVRFRKSATSSPVRARLRRAFERLAIAPAGGGRPRKRELPESERAHALRVCGRILRDVTKFRREWKGSLRDAQAFAEARELVSRHVPDCTIGCEKRTAKNIIESRVRPQRAAEALAHAALADLTVPTIRALLAESKRTQHSRG